MKNIQLCHIRLDSKIYKKIKQISVQKEKTISYIVNEILERSFNPEQKPKKKISKKNKK